MFYIDFLLFICYIKRVVRKMMIYINLYKKYDGEFALKLCKLIFIHKLIYAFMKVRENNMNKLELLYSGKAKEVYKTDDEKYCIFEYRDDATAFNGEKKGSFEGKGTVNNIMANVIFKLLEKEGVKTHFVKQINDRETLVRKVNIIPLEVIVRNTAAGSFSKRYGVDEGTALKEPTVEFSYKNDDLGDPLINSYHAVALNIASRDEINEIVNMAFKVNNALKSIFIKMGIKLIDFKIEVGKTSDGEIILADEISPDTCRLWDAETNKKLDKDRFRFDLGEFSDVYFEVLNRLKESYPEVFKED